MIIPFVKMHAQGNDFVVLDLDRTPKITLTHDLVKKLCDRHFGIGCDQLLAIKARPSPHHYDYFIYNADGSESGQCGNGARCIGHYLARTAQEFAGDFVLYSSSGAMRVTQEDRLFSVEMPAPVMDFARIPFLDQGEQTPFHFAFEGESFSLYPISLGNPHGVVFCEDVKKITLDRIGKFLSTHPRFPERANIEFVQIVEKSHIEMRVYERGVGETLACGSGAVAAVLVGQQVRGLQPRVRVTQSGGDVTVLWDAEKKIPRLSGETVWVFEGEMEVFM